MSIVYNLIVTPEKVGNMSEIHHLTLEDRKAIQEAIESGRSKKEMARMLKKDVCGISR